MSHPPPYTSRMKNIINDHNDTATSARPGPIRFPSFPPHPAFQTHARRRPDPFNHLTHLTYLTFSPGPKNVPLLSASSRHENNKSRLRVNPCNSCLYHREATSRMPVVFSPIKIQNSKIENPLKPPFFKAFQTFSKINI